jgi:signal transduction histidine kinase/ABC-type amino acid transport substrate-binding protein
MNKKKICIIAGMMLSVITLTLVLVWGESLRMGKLKASPSLGGEVSPFASFRDIPGITAEEIAAIEELRAHRTSFIFGAEPNTTEAVDIGDGKITGFGGFLCDWLTDFFGIPFIPEIYSFANIIKGLETFEIDFTASLSPTEERRQIFFMTDPMAHRSIKCYRVAGSPSLLEIEQERQARYLMLEGAAAIAPVLAALVPDTYEIAFITENEQAYQLLKDGKADAYITQSHVEGVFDPYGDIVTNDFLPLIFQPVPLSTQNPKLKPVISVLTKALRNGAMPYLGYLYDEGYRNYMRHKMSMQLSDEERKYVVNHPVIPVVANYDNFPVCFYNTRENEWQGIFFDLLDEITAITGLTFKLINKNNDDWPVIYEMGRTGKAYIIADLVKTTEREKYFIWPETGMPPDYFALISRSDYRDITVNEIQNAKVGVARNTVYATIFNQWFPDHANTVEYENMNGAIAALGRGEVDLVMSTQRRLMFVTHFLELPGYKTNIVFYQPIQTISGVNRNEEPLCLIIDKALKIIDTKGISERWMRRTYDYRAKVAEARLPLLIGATALSLAVLVLMFLMFWRQRNEGRRMEDLVDIRTSDLNRQNFLMSTVNAAAVILLESDSSGSLNAINQSMEMVCRSVDADRVLLWKNFYSGDNKLHYKQVCGWMRAAYDLGENLMEYSYEESMPTWKNLLFAEKNINGPLDTLPGYDPATFALYTLKSILIVPLFIKDTFWGFVSFDDCHGRRVFPEADEYTLRSWGLLAVGAFQRGEIMRNLADAVDEAKKSSAEAMKAYAEAETASEAKSRFIANMNHEMRTPMNVIVGLTDLMLEEDNVPGKAKETLQKINTAGNTLMRLINDVLDISKIEAGKLELMPVEYDVASLLNDVITLNLIRSGEKPVTFKLDIDKNMPSHLLGDDIRIKQILNNLLSNAFKYTKEGTITLGVDCQVDQNAVWLVFCISDTGMGIRKEDLAKLFTDYNQVDTQANRKIEGTGLGLSITKKIVEMQEGEITVESEYGKGSVFRVRIRQGFVTDTCIGKETLQNLRMFCYSDKKKQAQGAFVRQNLSHARVLVVDDFPANLDVAAGMLRKYKMQVDCVTSGQESVDRITAGDPVYDAIFMDHMMPGMDGIEAVTTIRALGTEYAKNIPIIALTANAVAGNEQMFLENGFNAFLPKPFNVMSLDAVVHRWVRKKPESDG